MYKNIKYTSGMKLLLLLSALTLRPVRLQTIRPMVNDGASLIGDICEDHNANITLTICSGLSAAKKSRFFGKTANWLPR